MTNMAYIHAAAKRKEKACDEMAGILHHWRKMPARRGLRQQHEGRSGGINIVLGCGSVAGAKTAPRP